MNHVTVIINATSLAHSLYYDKRIYNFNDGMVKR